MEGDLYGGEVAHEIVHVDVHAVRLAAADLRLVGVCLCVCVCVGESTYLGFASLLDPALGGEVRGLGNVESLCVYIYMCIYVCE